ncbi:MAG: hypothetical protein DWQ20_00700 [Actinobacteria bacterium]|nr:MAG: hypothetical protein DWQ20_00700 [Actinomycetota bacterium]
MAYWIQDIEKEIYERLTGDTGSGGLFASGSELVSSVWTDLVPPSSDPWWHANGKDADDPTISFVVRGTSLADTTESAGRALEVVFTVECRAFDPSTPPGEIINAILNRIEGDWFDQASQVPTFGIDRWAPTLDGDYAFELPGFEWAGVEPVVPSSAERRAKEITFVGVVHQAGA